MSRSLIPALLLLSACTVDRDIELTADLEAVVASNNAFSADLYGAAAAEDEDNLFLSPFSVYSALGMTLAGAEGSTADEMRTVMYVDDEAAFHDNLGALMQDLDGRFKGYEIAIADRLFGQEGVTWEEDFLAVTKDAYDAELEEVDYMQDLSGAREDINDWVSRQTKGAIPELIAEGVLTRDTRMVLTNAIWFKGDWAEAFEEADTKTQEFTLASGSTTSVDMMNGELPASYGEFEGGKVLLLPYEGDEVALFVVLPDSADGLAALEAELDGETLSGWLDSASSMDVVIGLPRMELRQKLELQEILSDLGMPTAFSDAADFSGATTEQALKIDKVIHEGWVEVNEEGTEAAAATAISEVQLTAEHEDPPTFVADHPFLFGIRDELTGAILFMGRMSDPDAG